MEEIDRFKFPEEIKGLFDTMGHENKWKILELLLNNNNEMSYTGLLNGLDLEQDEHGKLNYYLKELQKGGWIRNFVKEGTEITDRRASFYKIAKFPMKAVEGMLKEAMNKKSYQKDPYQQIMNIIQERSPWGLTTRRVPEPFIVYHHQASARSTAKSGVETWVHKIIGSDWDTRPMPEQKSFNVIRVKAAYNLQRRKFLVDK